MAINGYARNLSTTSPTIAVQGLARSSIASSGTGSIHGGVFIAADGGVGSPNNNMIGAEDYLLLNNTTSAGVAHSIGGAFSAQPTLAIGLEIYQPVANSGGPYYWPKGIRFDPKATLAPTLANFTAGNVGLEFNGVDTVANSASQGMCFLSIFSDASGNLSCFGELSDGNMSIVTSRGSTGLKVNGARVDTARMLFGGSIPFVLTSTGTFSFFIPDNPITVTRLTAVTSTQGVTCSTAPIVQITDGTNAQSLTLANATTTDDSGAISQNYAAGASLTLKVSTAASGCGTVPAGAFVNAEYKMQ